MQKTYQFNKILKEYNKLHHHTYRLPTTAFNVRLVHTISLLLENNNYTVTYSDKEGLLDKKKSLGDFTYFHISHSIDIKDIIDIILSKETEKLNLKIEIWPSNKIMYAYLYANYAAKGVGNLGKSCMRVKEMQKSLIFYIKNEVRVVVVIDNKNKIHARALLWENVKCTQNKKVVVYLDRIYTNSDLLLPLFSDLAKENNWKFYKTTKFGNAANNLYKDNLDIKDICHFPYTDTFRHLYYKNNIVVSGDKPQVIKHPQNIHLTIVGNGGYFPELDPNRVTEVLTGHFISKKDAVKVKRYDGYVLRKNIADINGDFYSVHDSKVINTALDGYILKDNSVCEVITNDKINKITSLYSNKYKGHIHKSNVVCIQDKLYHKKDNDIVCFSMVVEKKGKIVTEKKWYHISECFINYDRKEVNKEFAKCPLFCPTDFMPYWARSSSGESNKPGIARDGTPIPKEYAIVAYNIICNGQSVEESANSFAEGSPKFDKIKFLKTCDKDVLIYQEVYLTDTENTIQLVTGELVINRQSNKKYLKKFNNKWYIKQDFEAPNKKQLVFNFKE